MTSSRGIPRSGFVGKVAGDCRDSPCGFVDEVAGDYGIPPCGFIGEVAGECRDSPMRLEVSFRAKTHVGLHLKCPLLE
jgi:hypothetical protein